MRTKVALLYGGVSSEHEVSVLGYEYVSELLRTTDLDVLPVYIDKDGSWSVYENGVNVCVYPTAKDGGSLYTGHGFIRIDAAIPLLHGEGGEDGSVQGALEVAGIPYIGADVCTSALCLDKVYTKTLAKAHGVPTVPGVSFGSPTDTDEALALCEEKLGFPMFIKPRRLGSSVGAYQVENKDTFRRVFPLSMKQGSNLVTVERMLEKKRELECAFYEARGKRIITPPGEILIDGFYGYGEKYGGKTHTRAVADLTEATVQEIHSYCEVLADTFGLRHLARIDFFLSGGHVFFNEINTFPGFTRESLYPKMLLECGISPTDALISFVEDALAW